MNATKIVAAALAALLVSAGAVAAAPGAQPDGQLAVDDHNESAAAGASDAASENAPDDASADDDADENETEETETNADAGPPADVPAANAEDRGLPAQASDTAKTVQDTIASWFASDEDQREADSLGEKLSSVLGGDDEADANESADAGTDADGEAGTSADAGANADETGQQQASENANDDGIINAVVSFLGGDSA